MPLPLVPLPAHVIERPNPDVRIDAATTISGDADTAVLLQSLLEQRTGIRVPIGSVGTVDLRLDDTAAPESYRLDVGNGGIRLSGDAAGLSYGVHTLIQLVQGDADGWRVPSVEIADEPRFAYRGVMLDVARHFFDVTTVRAFIDRAASLKYNHLHLHLSDDQGWRLELHSRPELTARASQTAAGGAAGGFYTQEQYGEIVAYAASRHMTVVPEFDMPGHTHAVTLAYPEITAQPVLSDHIRDVAAAYGGGLPEHGTPYTGMAVGFSSLRTRDAAATTFVRDVFTEVATLTPGPYLHFGGDEALGTDPADFADFVAEVSHEIAALGKTPIAWHEAGAAPGLAPGTIGQYWNFIMPTVGSDERARAFVANGGRLVLSPADAIYLDMKPTADARLGLTWANGPTSVERAYRWEPSDVIAGITDADIFGVEAPLWTETVTDLADIDALVFPRIAAAAEAAWSPATGTLPDRTWDSFRARVGGLGALWTSAGIRFPASEEIVWTT
ncbi:family 20 glycosylhydrolase [Microbacterium dauci]|uniref:beta-N-acetylhexosaminidase n=1 Tax=Microbacterium dauci TaxID=3048008 RepID=A0ABT6Z9L5_9MICO|nr:family 20 glycosylhydrolase [Microbacterium sp. LX3-4]MDJ1112854.1 family 20 glycosylhydrolase [Microbacterium sp. LX3-4]